MEKVLQDQLPPDELPEPVLRIEAAKNEYEGGQVIIHATEDMKNVQVKVTDLVHASVDKRIEPARLKCICNIILRFISLQIMFSP